MLSVLCVFSISTSISISSSRYQSSSSPSPRLVNVTSEIFRSPTFPFSSQKLSWVGVGSSDAV